MSSQGQSSSGSIRDQIDEEDDGWADWVEPVFDVIISYHRPELGLWQKFEGQNNFSSGDAGEELEFIVQ